MTQPNPLTLRASSAFDAEFRDKLANAVCVHVLRGGRIEPCCGKTPDTDCKCPEGCMTKRSFPSYVTMSNEFGFGFVKHRAFQLAFDRAIDNGTPEAALGLIYRERFVR